MSRTTVLVVLVGLSCAPVFAQPPDQRPLAVSPRDTVFVTDSQGLERRCQLVRASADGVWVVVGDGQLLLSWPSVTRIEKEGDPVWDGAAKGAAISTGLVLFVGALGGASGEELSRAILGEALLWSTVGGIIDALHVGRTTLYVAGQPSGPRHGWRMREGASVAFGAKWEF